jgi:hypothetical protein
MPETVSVRSDEGIVEVHSYGEVTEQDLRASLESVAAICRDCGLSRVLVDAREETSLPPTLSLFQFGADLLHTGVLRTARFAVLASEVTRKDQRFLETVTRNRGLEIRIFDSEDDAIAWLTATAQKPVP